MLLWGAKESGWTRGQTCGQTLGSPSVFNIENPSGRFPFESGLQSKLIDCLNLLQFNILI